MTDWKRQEDLLLARELRQIAGHYWQLTDQGIVCPILCEVGTGAIGYSNGICYALKTLRKAEGTEENRPWAYDQVDQLLMEVEEGYDSNLVLPSEYDVHRWEARAWMCMLLAEWLEDKHLG